MQQDDTQPDPSTAVPSRDRNHLAKLTEALKGLQKHGVRNPQFVPPPILLQALGVDPAEPETKRQFCAALQAACNLLDKEQRVAFQISVGLRPDATGSRGTIHKKVQEALNASRSSAYRRIREAIRDLSVLLADGEFTSSFAHQDRRPAEDGLDFVTLATRCVVDLTTSTPSVTMTRSIQALRYNLAKLEESIFLQGLDGGIPTYTAISGCRMDSLHLDGEVLNVHIAFNKPLLFDERATFTTRLQVPNHAVMGDSMLFSPVTPTQRLSISLLADPNHLPERVQRFDGAWHVRVLNDEPQGEPLPQRAWENIDFSSMRQGKLYGITWSWPKETPR